MGWVREVLQAEAAASKGLGEGTVLRRGVPFTGGDAGIELEAGHGGLEDR